MKTNILISFLFVMIQYLTGATLKERKLILGHGFRRHSGKGMASNVQFLVMEACIYCFSQLGRSSSRERRTTFRAIALKGHPSVSHLCHPGPYSFLNCTRTARDHMPRHISLEGTFLNLNHNIENYHLKMSGITKLLSLET